MDQPEWKPAPMWLHMGQPSWCLLRGRRFLGGVTQMFPVERWWVALDRNGRVLVSRVDLRTAAKAVQNAIGV